MVLDTSSILAILLREPERHVFLAAIETASVRVMSTASVVEMSLVVLSRGSEDSLQILEALLRELKVDRVPVTADHAALAIDAFRRFGKGRHPARLNFGDCFSYALAKSTGEPLLFKGEAFSKTDIKRAA